MARSAFETVVQLQLDRYGPEEAKRRHIAIAQQGLARFLSGQTSMPGVQIEVDGHAASNENEVRPFGVITYRFQRMREIVKYALAQAQAFSPVLSGRYRASWFAMIDQVQVTLDEIPQGASVLLTNDQPFSRKINVGARGFEAYAPPGIVEKVRQVIIRKYGAIVTASVEFITLEGGYELKKGLQKINKGRRYGGVRNDAKKGMEITYPSLSLVPKF